MRERAFNLKYFPFKGQDKRSKHLYQLVAYLRAVSLCLTFCTNPRHIQGGILSHLQQVLLFLRLIKLAGLCNENEANRQSSCHTMSLATIVTVTAIVCCNPRLWLWLSLPCGMLQVECLPRVCVCECVLAWVDRQCVLWTVGAQEVYCAWCVCRLLVCC